MHFLRSCSFLAFLLLGGSYLKAQEKPVLDRDLVVSVQGELLDPMYDFYNSFKLTSRLGLDLEKKVSTKRSLGVRLNYNRFKSYDFDMFTGTTSVSRDYSGVRDTVLPLLRNGYTRGFGAEVFTRVFRSAKGGLFPIGFYYEWGMGLHQTRFSGYTYQQWDEALSAYRPVEEEVQSVRSVSFSLRSGKQWLFENNLIFGFGIGLKGHLPLRFKSASDESTVYDARTLFYHDVLMTDWFSTYVRLGYLF
ncbi:MAG: hypothetical protein H6606_05125 [Flavobacteriales bacterium]|nr:hypothetical protein [Flavobacteriales bacterium]